MNYDMNMMKYPKNGFFQNYIPYSAYLFYPIWAYLLRR